MPNSTIYSTLSINMMELSIYLGWSSKERKKRQTILADIDLYFFTPPIACLTDNLDDTLCYASLIKDIRAETTAKEFHLVEHFGQYLFQLIQQRVSDKAKISISITKHPKIKNLGSICFKYSDLDMAPQK